MKLNKIKLKTSAAILFVLSFTAFADNSNSLAADAATLESLREQIQALDQKVRVLERERENDQDAAVAKSATSPKISLGASGFSFSSGDSNFVATIHGLVQLDSRTFFADGGTKGNDGFILRRARPILSGTVFRDFDYLLTPDFGGNTVQIQDAYLNYHYNPAWQVQAGKFKSPVGLEQLQSDPATAFNERSIANNLVPNRDLGVELHGDLFNGTLGYAVGIFNGAPDFSGTSTNADYDDGKAVAARLFAQPWKNSSINALRGLGFGLGGSYESDAAATNTVGTGLTSGYTTDGQQRFFTYTSGTFANGEHWRLSPQAYYYYGPFGLLAEYVISQQEVTRGAATANLQNTAWEITGGWVLTGEDASYSAITPRHPFDLHNGGWGAWQLVARFGELDIDKKAFPTFASLATSASQAQSWSLGLNWYLNKNIRANASFSRTTFTDGKSGPVTRQPENVVFTRLQLLF